MLESDDKRGYRTSMEGNASNKRGSFEGYALQISHINYQKEVLHVSCKR